MEKLWDFSDMQISFISETCLTFASQRVCVCFKWKKATLSVLMTIWDRTEMYNEHTLFSLLLLCDFFVLLPHHQFIAIHLNCKQYILHDQTHQIISCFLYLGPPTQRSDGIDTHTLKSKCCTHESRATLYIVVIFLFIPFHVPLDVFSPSSQIYCVYEWCSTCTVAMSIT